MASKVLLSRLRTLTQPTHHRLINPNFIFPLKNQTLIPSRPFSDALQPSPVDSNPPPTTADNPPKNKKISSSLNQAELAKFSAIAETWWDAEGPFKPLHVMNPTRLAFIRSTLCRHFGKDPYSAKPFEGLKFVDVGCGGGILSEPLARMGATVTGIDAVEKNIKIALLHAKTWWKSRGNLMLYWL